MELDIVIEPNTILREKSREIKPADFGDPAFIQLIQDLSETMYKRDGVGIAAPQAGKPIRLCVIAKEYSADKKNDLVLVNPVWIKKTIKRVWGEEGCLSVPNIYGQVKRYKKIKVQALDEKGNKLDFDAEDFPARIIQHEIDHLDGILFIDKAKNLYQVDKKL